MKRNREDSSEAARMKREAGGMGPRIWGVCCGTKRGHTLLLQARAQGLEEEPPRLSQVGRGGSAAQLGSLRAHSAPGRCSQLCISDGSRGEGQGLPFVSGDILLIKIIII